MLTINLEWDANALAAPQSFRDAVQAAASILEAAIYDPITVNIAIGYGEINGTTTLNQGESFGGPTSAVPISYSLLKAALTSNASYPSDVQALAALPSTTSLDGQTNFALSRAQAKALGALPATDPSVDGSAGFPTSFTGSGLTGAAIVELIHAMGLINDGDLPLSLVEYTSPGQHLLSSGYTSTTPAYFSLDGGITNLANYDVGFDDTLFLTPGDALSINSSGNQTLSALDLSEISAVGFDVTSARPTATPVITPTPSAAATRPILTLQNVSLVENTTIPVAALIKSVTVPAGDSIASYAFADLGSVGHLALGGVVEPASQYVSALGTQLDALDYVAGTTPGTDTVYVSVIDDTTGLMTFADASVTTVASTPATSTSPSGTTSTTITGGVTTTINGDGVTTIVTGSGVNTVQLGAAQAIVTSTGTDTILASTGPATITTSGNAHVTGGAGALTVQGGAGNDVVSAGPGGLTFTGGGGFDTVLGNGGPATITAGTGGGLLQGGGDATIIAGSGGALNLEFGSNGDQMYAVGMAGVLFGDNGGPSARPTLMSSAADTGNSVFFGAGGAGQMTFITGSGNDLLAVGRGVNTVELGSGSDVVFANAPTAGATTIYAGSGNASVGMGGAATDFIVTAGSARAFSLYNDALSTDRISIVGYGPNQVSTAIANQVATPNGALLTLGDGTTLALIGIQHATASLFA